MYFFFFSIICYNNSNLSFGQLHFHVTHSRCVHEDRIAWIGDILLRIINYLLDKYIRLL